MKHSLAILIIVITTIIQLSIIGKVGAGDSEAYYYSWSRSLSLSYYDHPAGIALLIRIATEIFGHTPFALRFFPTIAINLALLIIYWISFLHYKDNKTALFSILFFISMPAFLIGGVSASPEPPLILFCTISLLFFYLYYTTEASVYLILSSLFAGIAFNFKYSALFLVIVYLIILNTSRKSNKKTNLILLSIIFVSMLPVIIWNILHRGASFEYHLINRFSLRHIPLNFLKLIVGQLLYFNPILITFTAYITYKKIKIRKIDLYTKMFVILFGLSALIMLTIRDSEPHWSSLAYIPAAILLARELRIHRGIMLSSILLNTTLFSLFLIHIFTPIFSDGILRNQNPKYDITNELFGWEAVGENLEYIISQKNLSPDEVLLASNHYTMSAQLMLSTKGRYRTICRGARCNQFKIDDIEDTDKYKLIIFVTDNRFTKIPDFFKRGSIEQKLKIYRDERVIREFHIFIKDNK
jgi:4-amino-4-deoxy-L-arabinose transferase-like glycosyltransferase